MTIRERRILCATAVLAVGVPLGAHAWIRARTDELAAHLGAAGGVPARIGSVDADLTGAIRLTDVALGRLVAVDTIEASVAMSSLLGGHLRADEIRLDGPRVAVDVDATGDSDLARLARRIAHRGGTANKAAEASGVRRIIVAHGALRARIAGVGELAAEDVELVPDATGVRVITGPVTLTGDRGTIHVELAFGRSAAELRMPEMQFGRVLAVGGSGRVTIADRPIDVRDVAAGRLVGHGELELRGAIVEPAGVTRPVAVDVAPGDRAITFRGDGIPLAPFAALLPSSLDVTRARASGTFVLRRKPARLEVTADGTLDDLVIDHPNIASTPFELDAQLRGDLAVTPEAFAVPQLAIALGDLQLATSGWVRRNGPASGQLEVRLQSAPCAALLASLPFRGPLDGMVVTGELGARARLTVDLAAPPGSGVALATGFTGKCNVLGEPPEADVTTLTRVSMQQLADGSRARIGEGEPTWQKLRALPYHVPGAFISAEDGRFWEHPGFDLEQIARSLEIDLRERRLARGGSTISQQLVKNAFLSSRRTLDRKIQEAILTWRLEERLDKKQILERYLNILELGPKIFGLRAAANYWFDRSPRELDVKQAAFLAALTSQPTSMSRRIRRTGGLDPQSAERVAVVLRAMRRDGVISTEAYNDAVHTTLWFTPLAVPRDD